MQTQQQSIHYYWRPTMALYRVDKYIHQLAHFSLSSRARACARKYPELDSQKPIRRDMLLASIKTRALWCQKRYCDSYFRRARAHCRELCEFAARVWWMRPARIICLYTLIHYIAKVCKVNIVTFLYTYIMLERLCCCCLYGAHHLEESFWCANNVHNLYELATSPANNTITHTQYIFV